MLHSHYPALLISGPSVDTNDARHFTAVLRPHVAQSQALISIFYCSIQTMITSKTKHPFRWCDQFQEVINSDYPIKSL